jgi:hypothetical protein
MGPPIEVEIISNPVVIRACGGPVRGPARVHGGGIHLAFLDERRE